MKQCTETGTELEPHTLAELFPPLEGEEFEALAADIRANGLLEPITTYQGKILDGRNRARACAAAGVALKTREFAGPGSPVEYVFSRNILRRHLNESQRAMSGARLKEEFAKEAKLNMSRGGKGLADLPTRHSRDQAAEAVNVSPRLVGSAEKVLQHGVPELIDAVTKGKVAVTPAAEIAKLTPAAQSEVVSQGPSAVKKAAANGRAEKAKRAAKGSASPAGGPVLSGTDAVGDEEPDELWLQGFSIRSKLSGGNKEKFDREATYWRRLKALDDRIRAADPGFVAEACDRLREHGSGPLLADAFLFVRRPADWRLCEDCRGSGVNNEGRTCWFCSGDGFRNLRHFDPFDEIEDSQPGVDEGAAEACRGIEAGEAPRDAEEPAGPRKGRPAKGSSIPPASKPAKNAATTPGSDRRGRAGRDEPAGAPKALKSRRKQAVDAETQAPRRPSRRRGSL
ncbi:hypothetical protein [Paludisphaera soli]|uniref:hypothetical protein n=1 Tax=Paludisphaera soli TaxID=2712865 RepID=UPI0013EA883D|nr:hypothetical protein [Paludisphaera soli]